MVAAGLALALVVLEIYSLGAFLVAQRTREMGIRLVLGAGSRRMFWTVVVGGLGSSRHFSASTGAGRATTLLLSARSSSALRVCRLAGFHDNGSFANQFCAYFGCFPHPNQRLLRDRPRKEVRPVLGVKAACRSASNDPRPSRPEISRFHHGVFRLNGTPSPTVQPAETTRPPSRRPCAMSSLASPASLNVDRRRPAPASTSNGELARLDSPCHACAASTKPATESTPTGVRRRG